jgi:uncharacterized protein (DUF302 family)
MATGGLTTIKSNFGPEDTMSRLEAEVKARGMTVFAHIPHAKGAAAVGVPLRPNDLLIFGNAKVGTPLMQSAPTTGIDLPLKVLIWQDAEGTWGVLDRLLEDERLEIEGISGTSAGAMNAGALLQGYLHAGRSGAREALDSFWHHTRLATT